MAEKKTPAKTTQPAARKQPTAAALKAAVAQLEEKESGKKKNTALMRVGAFVLWALAAVAMYLPQLGTWELPFGATRMLFLGNLTETIIDIVVAGVLCVCAALLWKKANHIHPTKSHSKAIQFIWNQLGVIMAGIIFAPLAIIMIVKSDKLDKKTRAIVAAVLAAVFLGTSFASADYHPVTQDEVDVLLDEAAEYGYTGEALWTKYGRCYHFSEDCQALKNTQEANLFNGTLEEALDAHRTNACSFCAVEAAANAAQEAEDGLKLAG